MTTATLLPVRRPSDGSTITSIPIQGPEEVRQAVARARAAQELWATVSPGDRARRMKRLARVMGARRSEIAGRIVDETGKPRTEALAEVAVSADLIHYYAREAPRLLRARRVGTGWMVWTSAWVEYEPFGVIGGITPWNYPFIMIADVVVPALFAGNAAVVKPSEFTPWSAFLMPDLIEEAGLPRALVQIVTGDGGTGAALVEAGVDKVMFTGSTATGRRVMATAAKMPIPVTMELGGKDPALVLDDADLERAAHGVAYGAFFNAGQTCISVERCYVERPVYDAFVARLAAVVRELRADGEGRGDVGPMITPPQYDVVQHHLRDAVGRGARVAAEASRVGDHPAVVPPTVLVDVGPDMAVVRDETFGPLLTVTPVEDEADAVLRANDHEYALFASVWTGDRDRGVRVGRQIRAGGVLVNEVLSHFAVPGLPMGGQGASGFGKRRGREGLLEMSRTRSVMVHRFGLRRELWWFPYSRAGVRLVDALTVYLSRHGLRGIVAGLRAWLRNPRGDTS